MSYIGIGDRIPEFNTEAYNPKTDEFFPLTDKDVLKEGKWSVFMFYPADFTFVCPTELEDLQDQYDKLQELNVEVYSFSTDTHFVHKAWHDSSQAVGKVQYIMVGDSNKEITESFGILDDTGKARRATYLIDPEGNVQTLEINADGIGRDASVLLDKVQAAQFVAEHEGEVCPAKWKESKQTLTPGLDLVGKI